MSYVVCFICVHVDSTSWKVNRWKQLDFCAFVSKTVFA
jgi:hypothetical protein